MYDNLFYCVFGCCCFHFDRMSSHPLQIQAVSHMHAGLSHMHASTGCRTSDNDFTYKSDVRIVTVEVLECSALAQRSITCRAVSWLLWTQLDYIACCFNHQSRWTTKALFKVFFNRSRKIIQPFIKLLFPSCFMLLFYHFLYTQKSCVCSNSCLKC